MFRAGVLRGFWRDSIEYLEEGNGADSDARQRKIFGIYVEFCQMDKRKTMRCLGGKLAGSLKPPSARQMKKKQK